MPYCDYCQGSGTIPPDTASELPMKCYRCAGSGNIDWNDLRPGDHVCYVYEDKAEQLRTIAKFLAKGFQLNERVLYVREHHTATQLDEALKAEGVDAPAECAKGALVYLTKEETYLAGGKFDAQCIINGWRKLLKDSLTEGYTGIRGAAEASWLVDDPACFHDIINYELMVDLYFLNEQPRITGVCQYDRNLFPDAFVDGAKLSHRLVFQDYLSEL
jgi:hypothetical protein